MFRKMYYHLSKMIRQSLLISLLALTVIFNVGAQDISENSQASIPKIYGRVGTFVNVFTAAVKNSPQLLRVFDVSAPSSEISTNAFYAFRDAMKGIGAPSPDSLAKSLADAMYLSLPSMSQEVYIFVLSRSVGMYLLQQEILKNLNDSVKIGQEFSDAILKHYPTPDNVNQLTLAKALWNGCADTFKLYGNAVMEHIPAFDLNAIKHTFGFSYASKPLFDVSVIAPPDTIPSVDVVFGVSDFSKAFIHAVELSPALQRVFFSPEPVSVISKSWEGALDLFCSSIDCLYRHNYRIQNVLSKTYNYMSKSTYVKAIAEAFPMLEIGLETFTSDSADIEGHKLATLIESLVNSLPADADLQTRLGTILEAFRQSVGNNYDIKSQYPAFYSNMVMGFFSAVPIAAQISDF